MIKYTCVICEEQHPFDYMHLIDDRLVCNQCHWNTLWNNKEIREFKKRNDPKKPVLDLIDSLQNEVRRAAGDYFYDNIYCAMEVRDVLNEIQQVVYGDEDTFDERPYYHLYTFHDEFGYKKQTYPKYKKDVAMEMYKYCKKGMDKGIIGDTILLEGYNVEED